MEQLTMIKAAEKAMTEAQLEKVTCHQGVIDTWCENSLEPGPSNNKEKGIDPLEWGNAGLSEEKLNIEAQKVVLEAYNAYKERH